RLAGAALPDAQLRVVTIEHLQIAGVHALRKAAMALDARSLRSDRRGSNIGDDLHRVRIAHGNESHAYALAVHVQDFFSGKHRTAHLHRHLAVALEARPDESAERLDPDLAL